MKLYQKSGYYLIATGIIHNALGLIMGREVLLNILKDGFFNSINMETDRNAIFWFLFTGFFFMITGKLMQDYLSTIQKPLPKTLGYYLLALAVVGCAVMPVSGIWLAIPQALIIIRSGTKNESREIRIVNS